jgi:hypothetical protein
MSITTLPSGHVAHDAPALGRQPLAVRFFVAAGLIGPVFFFIVVIVEGTLRPGYSAWHHVVSTLALGPGGWVVTAGLAVLGVLLLCYAVGLRRVLNPGRGTTWPHPDRHQRPRLPRRGYLCFRSRSRLPTVSAATSTLHGILHNVLSVVFETPTIVAACIVLARRFAQAPGGRPWVIYSVATILVAVVLQFLAVLAYLSNDPGSPFRPLPAAAVLHVAGLDRGAGRAPPHRSRPLSRDRSQTLRGSGSEARRGGTHFTSLQNAYCRIEVWPRRAARPAVHSPCESYRFIATAVSTLAARWPRHGF